jgi:hypothetical protein
MEPRFEKNYGVFPPYESSRYDLLIMGNDRRKVSAVGRFPSDEKAGWSRLPTQIPDLQVKVVPLYRCSHTKSR